MSLFSNGGMSPADIAAVTGNCNNGFGNGDGWWIILLLLFAGNGWGNGFGNGFGGYGNMMLGYDFPWLLQGQNNVNANTNNGFRDQMINDGISSIRTDINALSNQLCNCGNDLQMGLTNGFFGVEQGANTRQIANMNQAFAAQTAMAQGFNNVQAQLSGLGSDLAREACATRTNDTQNSQAILNAINSGVQSIKDQMCNDKIDAKNEKINELQNRLNIAEQNNLIQAGFSNEVDQLYNRLNNCPVPTTPVYGRTPIFQCNSNGCGCGNF